MRAWLETKNRKEDIMPEVVAVHANKLLTNVAIAHKASGFIADRVFADVPVNKQTDSFVIFDAERRALKQSHDIRGPGDAPFMVDYDVGSETYRCDPHALSHLIPDELRANADPPIQLTVNAIRFLMEKMLTFQEVNCKAKLDAVLVSNQTAAAAFVWTDVVNGVPLTDVETGIHRIEDETGLRPNFIGMDSKVFDAARRHPTILERTVYGGTNASPAEVSEAALAGIFGVDEVLVSKTALVNAAVKGQSTTSITRVWSNDVYIGFRPLRPALMEPALGYRFIWRPFSGGVGGFLVAEDRHEAARRRSDVVTVEKHYDQKITLATAGYRISAVI